MQGIFHRWIPMVRDMYCSMLYVIVCRDDIFFQRQKFRLQSTSFGSLFIYIYIGHLNTILRECPPFFFNFILGSRLRTTPLFVFSYAFLNKTTFGNVLGLSDPYVTLRLLPEDLFGKEVKKTETIKSTLFPLFDEQFDL